jgi:hypothetical protein
MSYPITSCNVFEQTWDFLEWISITSMPTPLNRDAMYPNNDNDDDDKYTTTKCKCKCVSSANVPVCLAVGKNTMILKSGVVFIWWSRIIDRARIC